MQVGGMIILNLL